jgi:NAD(P)-dependent dehydrogenase (short-subunit alcohol dehydrogenase family)
MPKSKNDAVRGVLITGASTGIGEACALHLAARGWRVFAGVRKTKDGDALVEKTGTIMPILLDVTRPDQIADAVKMIGAEVGEGGLWGLVNNAGIAVPGVLEVMPMEAVERQFQVNVFGVVAVTQAFLPLVRAAGGRIVLMSSNSGFWCEPFMGAYGGTKHAIEGIADSLRVELHPWGIRVVLIEPGMIRTPLWEKSRAAADQLIDSMAPESRKLYEGPIMAAHALADKAEGLAIKPERVARAVAHALEARRPKTRYPVGLDSRLQFRLRRWMPDWMRDRIGLWLLSSGGDKEPKQ